MNCQVPEKRGLLHLWYPVCASVQIRFKALLKTGVVRAEDKSPGHLREAEEQVPFKLELQRRVLLIAVCWSQLVLAQESHVYSRPSSGFSDIKSVLWNWPSRECLYHWHWQTPQIRALFFSLERKLPITFLQQKTEDRKNNIQVFLILLVIF